MTTKCPRTAGHDVTLYVLPQITSFVRVTQSDITAMASLGVSHCPTIYRGCAGQFDNKRDGRWVVADNFYQEQRTDKLTNM